MSLVNTVTEAVERFAVAIINRTDRNPAHFEETLQDAIAGVLHGLDDEKQADLYARIVEGNKLVLAGNALFPQLLRYELRRTNLWSAI